MSAIRLQRYLSQAGVAARRKAEDLIVQGAVAVNGTVVTKLGSKVVPGEDRVTVDGQAVYPQELFYAILNKPKGCITAVTDPEGRPTVMEYLHKLPVSVAPVGRLDFYSEGVLLFTNDGELSARLQSPRRHVEKTYHVKVRDRVKESHLQTLRDGVELDDGKVTRPAEVDRLRSKSRHQWLVITLTEGKSRQIHRMLGALDYVVLKIQRVAYGGITFHGLRVGDARELTQTEVNELRSMVKLAKSTVSRGKWSSRREDTELGRRARARARSKAEAEEMADTRFTDTKSGRRPGPGSDSRSGPKSGSRSGSRPGAKRSPSSRSERTTATRGSRSKTAGTSRRTAAPPRGRTGVPSRGTRSNADPSGRGKTGSPARGGQKKTAAASRTASGPRARNTARPGRGGPPGTSSRRDSATATGKRSSNAPSRGGPAGRGRPAKGASSSRTRSARPAQPRGTQRRGKSSKR